MFPVQKLGSVCGVEEDFVSNMELLDVRNWLIKFKKPSCFESRKQKGTYYSGEHFGEYYGTNYAFISSPDLLSKVIVYVPPPDVVVNSLQMLKAFLILDLSHLVIGYTIRNELNIDEVEVGDV